jgi:hypothetical protein
MDVYSEDGLEATALANTVIPETHNPITPDIYGEAVERKYGIRYLIRVRLNRPLASPPLQYNYRFT